MTDVQRPRRVRGNELDRYLVTGSLEQASVLFAQPENVLDHARQRTAMQEEIDEARPGDFEPFHLPGLRHPVDDGLGQLARRLPGGLGQNHRHIRGELPVFRRARTLQLRGGFGARRQNAVSLQVQQGLGQQFFQMFSHGVRFLARPGRASEQPIVNR